MNDILLMDACGQLERLSSKRISARELLTAAIAQAKTLNPGLNAVVARDTERALRDAQAVDDRRARGEPLGALAGLPMTVKDTLDVEGLPASAGMRSLLGRSAEDALVVARVRAADAIIWGKTNTPEAASDWQTYNALYGTTNNPWDTSLTPGGSSGGSAVAIATGMAALEIGADIGGSLRIPASFCGICAHKPSYGRIPMRGLVPPVGAQAEMDLAVVGPMARSARDLQLALPVMTGEAVGDVTTAETKQLRAALWFDDRRFALDPGVRQALELFSRMLAGAGVHTRSVESPVDVETLMSTYVVLLFSLMGASLTPRQRALYEALRGPAKLARGLGADVLSGPDFILGYTARHHEWLSADETRARLSSQMATFFADFDVLLAPVSPTAAFAHDHRPLLRRRLACTDGRRLNYFKMWEWPALATVCGLPATVVPVGRTRAGLPVGIQIIGPAGGDAITLAVARRIEETLGGFEPPPTAIA